MKIKRAEVVESLLNEENGEVFAKVVLLLEVEDDSRTSYVTEIDISSPPLLTWDILDAKEKERLTKNSLKGRTY